MTNLFNQLLNFILGPKDKEGKIKLARPIGIFVVVLLFLVILTFLTQGFIWVIVIGVAAWCWIIFDTNKKNKLRKKKEEIVSLIRVSQITETREIAKRLGFDRYEVEKLLSEMITQVNQMKNSSIKKFSPDLLVLKKAQLDLNQHKIILDKHALDTFSDKLGNTANSILNRFAPKTASPLPDWKCIYCNSMNSPEKHECIHCGAGRTE